MFCRRCGKKLENEVVYCPECGELNSLEGMGQRKPRVNVKKNMIDNVFKILLAIASIVVFFMPWINWVETQMNFFEVNIIISTTEALKDNILGIFGGDIEKISNLMNLDVSTVMKIINICWEDGGESIIFMQSSKWILFIIVAIILVNISYIIVLILGKEREWMMVSLILVHLIFSVVIMMMICTMRLETIGLGYGPIVMFVVQGVLGELAAQKEIDLRKKRHNIAELYSVNEN